MSTQKSTDLRSRTKAYALRIIRLYQGLPKSGEAKVSGNCSCEPIVRFAEGD